MNKPTISVVIPTCERPSLLTRALRSVLKQDLHPDEIIVIDDSASMESTSSVQHLIKTFGGCVFRNDRLKGASGARNCGAFHASGDFLAFLDDDDEWLPTYLKMALNLATKHKANLICTDFLTRNGDGLDLPEKRAPDKFFANAFLYHNDGMRGSNLFISREMYIQLGGFDESLKSLNDLDIAIRISENPDIVYRPLHHKLVRFNNHDGPRLSTPCSDFKRSGVRRFYEKYGERMSDQQRAHYCQWVRDMWSVDEYGNIVGEPSDAADGTSKSRSITCQDSLKVE